jgi:hypothetical protein
MASLDFFAVREDILDILGFLYAETDFRVFELASRFGQELREFRSAEEVERIFPIGLDVHGQGFGSTFHLWSPAVMHRLDIQRVALDPRRCEGHTHRYELAGGALVQLYLGGVHGRVITKSHYGHNSRERAEKWGVSGEADWGALAKLSSKVQYHIRKRLAVDRVPGRPILAGAHRLWIEGYDLKESANSPYRWGRNGLEPGGGPNTRPA